MKYQRTSAGAWDEGTIYVIVKTPSSSQDVLERHQTISFRSKRDTRPYLSGQRERLLPARCGCHYWRVKVEVPNRTRRDLIPHRFQRCRLCRVERQVPARCGCHHWRVQVEVPDGRCRVLILPRFQRRRLCRVERLFSARCGCHYWRVKVEVLNRKLRAH